MKQKVSWEDLIKLNMKITLENTGKKYNKEWIFKNINLEFSSTTSTVISGSNGSGKSTLLKVLSGFETPSKGSVIYGNTKPVSAEKIYQHVAYTSPYISVFEEYTIKELVSFYTNLKPLKKDINYSQFI